MHPPDHGATTRPLRRRAMALAAVAVLALGGLAACGDDDDADDGATTTTTTATGPIGDAGDGGPAGQLPSGEAEVVAEDFGFTGATVGPGATVAFDNRDSAPHTLTADDGAFDSGRVEGGSQGGITAPTEPGEHTFHCEIHPSMRGTLTVEG